MKLTDSRRGRSWARGCRMAAHGSLERPRDQTWCPAVQPPSRSASRAFAGWSPPPRRPARVSPASPCRTAPCCTSASRARHRGDQSVAAHRFQGDEAMRLAEIRAGLGRSRRTRALLFPPSWLSARAASRSAVVAVLHGGIRGGADRAAHCHRYGPHQAGQRGRSRRRVFRLATILRLEERGHATDAARHT